MHEIISTISLVGLAVTALAALGWYSMPRAERVAPTQVGLRQWAGITAQGVRLMATWGPRYQLTEPGRTCTPAKAQYSEL
ncbi:MAG: hypothetical protein WA892_02920 [Ornithinimicrobium sp.]